MVPFEATHKSLNLELSFGSLDNFPDHDIGSNGIIIGGLCSHAFQLHGQRLGEIATLQEYIFIYFSIPLILVSGCCADPRYP